MSLLLIDYFNITEDFIYFLKNNNYISNYVEYNNNECQKKIIESIESEVEENLEKYLLFIKKYCSEKNKNDILKKEIINKIINLLKTNKVL